MQITSSRSMFHQLSSSAVQRIKDALTELFEQHWPTVLQSKINSRLLNCQRACKNYWAASSVDVVQQWQAGWINKCTKCSLLATRTAAAGVSMCVSAVDCTAHRTNDFMTFFQDEVEDFTHPLLWQRSQHSTHNQWILNCDQKLISSAANNKWQLDVAGQQHVLHHSTDYQITV